MSNSQATTSRPPSAISLIIAALLLTAAAQVAAQPDPPQTPTDHGAAAAASNKPATAKGIGPSSATASSQPIHVSALDIAAKLAVLVLAVWGITWIVKTVRRNGITLGNGIWFGSSDPGRRGARLRDCASLSLAPGPAVHIIEVDETPIVVATDANGALKLLLELSTDAHQARDREQDEPDDAANSHTIQHAIADSLQQDAEWQKRRRQLVQALADRQL